MRNDSPARLAQAEWSIDELGRRYPPIWTNPNKKLMAKIATPSDAVHTGTVKVSRWKAPEQLPPAVQNTQVVQESGFYTYETSDAGGATAIHWHLNFADPLLFGYYGGSLFAQDEVQVCEHPILASVAHIVDREHVHGIPNLVRRTEEYGGPTPFLIQGAPRRCSIGTRHLYGDQFVSASQETILDAVVRLDPPTISNIVAIAAPPPSRGVYTRAQIERAFLSAYTGFRAMVLDSSNNDGHEKDAVVLHTGHWGCGAFGGNKGLMAAVQILAAGSAGVSRVHFWYGYTQPDQTAVKHGTEVSQLLDGMPMDRALGLLAKSEYSWGQANENHVNYTPPKRTVSELLQQDL